MSGGHKRPAADREDSRTIRAQSEFMSCVEAGPGDLGFASRPDGSSLPEMLFGERVSRAGFQVVFEFVRISLISEGEIRDETPRFVFGGMTGDRFVVRTKSVLQVRGEADVTLPGVRDALK